MHTWKRWLTGAVACLVFGLIGSGIRPAPSYAGTPTSPDVYVDGELLHFDVPPEVVNARTLVPLRMIFEALGASVSWNGATQTVSGTENGKSIQLRINSTKATVNGQTVLLDVPAKLINGRTLVPLRFIAESLGDTVGWNGYLSQVLITSHNAPQVRVIGADSTVQDGQAAAIEQLLQNRQILQQDEQTSGLTLQKPVWVYLTNSQAGYLQAVQTYTDGNNADLIANDSDGVAYQSHIVLPLQRNGTADEQAGTLAHELFHVLANQNGGLDLPSWINEGVAWQLGLQAEYADQPAVMRQQIEGQIRDNVLSAEQNRTLQPLLDDQEQEITSMGDVQYNVEWQDYLAVQQLVKTYGQDKLQAYLKRFATERGGAFGDVFGESEQAFQQQALVDLKQQMAATDSGLQITLQVPSSYQGSFSIMPQDSHTWQDFQLSPGVHTIQVYKNGLITGAGTVQKVDDQDTSVDNNTVYLVFELTHAVTEQGVRTDQGGMSFVDSFGNYFYNNAYLYDTNNQASYPVTNTLFGVQVLDVEPIHS